MEPLNKGHIGTSYFIHYREVVLFSEVLLLWEMNTVLSREIVLSLYQRFHCRLISEEDSFRLLGGEGAGVAGQKYIRRESPPLFLVWTVLTNDYSYTVEPPSSRSLL